MAPSFKSNVEADEQTEIYANLWLAKEGLNILI